MEQDKRLQLRAKQEREREQGEKWRRDIVTGPSDSVTCMVVCKQYLERYTAALTFQNATHLTQQTQFLPLSHKCFHDAVHGQRG